MRVGRGKCTAIMFRALPIEECSTVTGRRVSIRHARSGHGGLSRLWRQTLPAVKGHKQGWIEAWHMSLEHRHGRSLQLDKDGNSRLVSIARPSQSQHAQRTTQQMPAFRRGTCSTTLVPTALARNHFLTVMTPLHSTIQVSWPMGKSLTRTIAPSKIPCGPQMVRCSDGPPTGACRVHPTRSCLSESHPPHCRIQIPGVVGSL
ncbi:hypothetical protein BKA63DRAFT_259094 [Paraphoma chrysanthemicola]|nr:hypothetical protein BKA63DRAFT_259094 [Paraphoma chrysanthemicola]